MNSINTPLEIGTQEAKRVLKGVVFFCSILVAVAGLFFLGWELGSVGMKTTTFILIPLNLMLFIALFWSIGCIDKVKLKEPDSIVKFFDNVKGVILLSLIAMCLLYIASSVHFDVKDKYYILYTYPMFILAIFNILISLRYINE
ncbi:TPA: hypothetical protein PXM39_003600 [Yersinia enterocolitica]|nr:hypothetical protein [Yersinia enterocolitica]HDL6900993.1 hypothetical protein [Yersinia enterocolitica]HDL7092099.1 hypothetical protein [Yersinia enterocolitica]HDL7101137.1 hypothetical protein [Yersinia enterocolitica]HDL7135619.1 hypothetical protein [Yersinia enterocolitica]